MTYRSLAIFLTALVITVTSASAGEILLADYHIAITLPDGWQRVDDQTPGILVRAQADTGRLRLIFSHPPITMEPESVHGAGYQNGIKQSLIDHGFTKIIRGEVIRVAGSDAYLCEAAREDKPVSVIQVMWFHEGHPISLVFLTLAKPFKDVPDVQAIIDSVKVLPK